MLRLKLNHVSKRGHREHLPKLRMISCEYCLLSIIDMHFVLHLLQGDNALSLSRVSGTYIVVFILIVYQSG